MDVVCTSADLVILEEEYPAWVVFSHLLPQVPCISTKKTPKKLIIILEKNLEGVALHYMSK